MVRCNSMSRIRIYMGESAGFLPLCGKNFCFRFRQSSQTYHRRKRSEVIIKIFFDTQSVEIHIIIQEHFTHVYTYEVIFIYMLSIVIKFLQVLIEKKILHRISLISTNLNRIFMGLQVKNCFLQLLKSASDLCYYPMIFNK